MEKQRNKQNVSFESNQSSRSNESSLYSLSNDSSQTDQSNVSSRTSKTSSSEFDYNSDSDYDTSSIIASTYIPETVYSSDEDDRDLGYDSSEEERKTMLFTPKKMSINDKLKEKQIRIMGKTIKNEQNEINQDKTNLSKSIKTKKDQDLFEPKKSIIITNLDETKPIIDIPKIELPVEEKLNESNKDIIKNIDTKNVKDLMRINDENELPEEDQKNILKDSLLKGNFRDKNIIKVLNESKLSNENILIFKSYWGILLQSKKISLDLSSLCFHFPNSIFHSEKNMISIQLEQPTCLFTITNRGKIMISGCNSKESLLNGTKKLIYFLQEIGFTQIEYSKPICMNIIGLSLINISQINDKFNDNDKLKLDLIRNEIISFEISVKNKKQEIINIKPFHIKENDNNTLVLECHILSLNQDDKKNNKTIPFTIMIITLEGKIGMFAKSLNFEIFSFEQLENYHNWILKHFLSFLYKNPITSINSCIINDMGITEQKD